MSLDRRTFLRSGAFALGAGAFLAACGSGRQGNTDPGRLGVAPPLATLPGDRAIDDAAWLRTLQGISLGMVALYDGIAAHGSLPGAAAPLAARFVADHRRTADALGALVSAAGGSPATRPNQFFLARQIEPALAALSEADGYAASDDLDRDLSNLAAGFEEWAARSFQAGVVAVKDPAARRQVAVLAGEASRRSAGLAAALSPDTLISPALAGGQPETDENDFPVLYALPARFGQLTGIELQIGGRNSDGARRKITLQTPADNALLSD